MLIHDFMPKFDVSERYEIEVAAAPDVVHAVLRNNFVNSPRAVLPRPYGIFIYNRSLRHRRACQPRRACCAWMVTVAGAFVCIGSSSALISEETMKGKFVAIEVESGQYFIDDLDIKALTRARREFPHKVFYLKRIGHRAVHKHHGDCQEAQRVSDRA
jgi:hypothetical protein